MHSAVENTKIMSIEGIIPIFDVVLTFRGTTGRELHGDFFNFQGLLHHGRQQSKYTLLRICSTPTFPIFNLSGFERELLKLYKQMISHFVALDVGYIICQVQLCNCIRGCYAIFLLKNTLFKQEVVWQPLN